MKTCVFVDAKTNRSSAAVNLWERAPLLSKPTLAPERRAAYGVPADGLGESMHRTEATVRWPVACLAAVVPLLTLALMIYSGRHSRPGSSETQAETSDAPARMARANPAVPFSGHDTPRRIPDDTRSQERTIVRTGLPPRSPVPQPSFRPPLDNKPQVTVELTGIIGIPSRTRALLEIAEPGFGRTVKQL